jgi:hypothetical protein
LAAKAVETCQKADWFVIPIALSEGLAAKAVETAIQCKPVVRFPPLPRGRVRVRV